MATNSVKVKVFINPLLFPEVEEPFATALGSVPVTSEHLIEFLCGVDVPGGMDNLLARYREIAPEPVQLFAAPLEPTLLAKVIWPLRHAKASYVLGNYLATVALCGMVAEMLAILQFDLAKPGSNAAAQFERKGQNLRIKRLLESKLIDQAIADGFNRVREIRIRHLHIYSHDQTVLRRDAVDAYHSAVALTVSIFGHGVSEGKLVFRQDFLNYLAEHGLVSNGDDEAA